MAQARLKRHRFEQGVKEGMSLVDYDDTSSDDDVLPAAEHKAALPQPPQQKPSPPKSRWVSLEFSKVWIFSMINRLCSFWNRTSLYVYVYLYLEAEYVFRFENE